MIFQNIDFHNVEEIEESEKGYILWRVPAYVRKNINEIAAKTASRLSSGIELRFKMRGDSATIILQADEIEEASVAYLYFGSFQGGWQLSSKMIGTKDTRITIRKPEKLEVLQQITEERHLPFSPEVVRIVLPYTHCCFKGVEGEIEPPAKSDVPNRTYLAYGSSITHGSLALSQPYTYPFRIAQILHCDYLNLGFAGTAQMERAMAEYLVSRKDWDFASVEMGINMVSDSFSEELFEERIKGFIQVMAKDPRPVFATSLFGFTDPKNQEKAARLRKIVETHAAKQLIYTDGLALLNRSDFISQDLVHPSLEGMDSIVQNWCSVMQKNLAGEK